MTEPLGERPVERNRPIHGRTSQRMRRALATIAVVVVWTLTFLITWRFTGSTNQPCKDVGVIGVAAACRAPGPSLFPAIPLASVAAVLVWFGGLRWSRRVS